MFMLLHRVVTISLSCTHAPCTETVPLEVSGIGCTKTKQKIPTGAGIREKVVHVVCNPRPVETEMESVVFGPLTIAEGAVAAEVQDVHKSWDQEAEGLSRACLRDANHVTLRHRCGPRLCLDDRW